MVADPKVADPKVAGPVGGLAVSADLTSLDPPTVTRLGLRVQPATPTPVAVIVPDANTRVLDDPYYAGVVRTIFSKTMPGEIRLFLLSAHTPDGHEAICDYLASSGMSGAIIFGVRSDEPLPDRLWSSRFPVVVHGRVNGSQPVPYVDTDNVIGGRLAVEHLIGLGRRRIATITGELAGLAGRDRLDGYRQALADAGLTPDPDFIEPGDYTRSGGTRAMRALLTRVPELDAVFVASDLMAAAAVAVLRDHGRSIPDDVAVVGFDDNAIARRTDPPLTTIRQNGELMAVTALEMLSRQINNPGTIEPPRILVPEIVVRSSA